MGEVWRASHQMLARPAAIKLVKPAGASSARQADVFIKRFRREANMIAGLQSPHTVYLYDFGTAQDGRFYYVMELLDGISLQTLVTTFGPQPASRVIFILRQICSSLDEAHEQGLVHRDLKPSNVMLCTVAKRHDFVKVLDFGLAKSVAPAERVDVSQLTVEGVAAGTPGYIAPEVALGDARRGRAGRSLRARLRRLRAAHRNAGVSRPESAEHDAQTRAGRAGSAVAADGAADSARSRAHHSAMSGEESGGPSGQRP